MTFSVRNTHYYSKNSSAVTGRDTAVVGRDLAVAEPCLAVHGSAWQCAAVDGSGVRNKWQWDGSGRQ